METRFNDEEREVLVMVLQKEENTLQIEINRAEHRDYKSFLKERLKTIQNILEKVSITETHTNL